MTAAYPDVVRDSAEWYLIYLETLIASGQLSEPGQTAASSLVESIRACLADGSTRSQVAFNAKLLEPCTVQDRACLVNQQSLGIGNDAARVVVMGTEHAYDVESSPVGLALESCGSALLWLNDHGPELAEQIAQDPKWVRGTGRAYHRHPSDHYSVGSGHTWRTVADVLRVSLNDLGDHAYQVERSAHPSRASFQGEAPTPERREFLVRLLRAFRASAQVLILHGKTGHREDDWDVCNDALTAAFLDDASMGQQDELRIGKASIRRWTTGDRTVIHTWALNGGALARSGAKAEYITTLTEVVLAGLRPAQPREE